MSNQTNSNNAQKGRAAATKGARAYFTGTASLAALACACSFTTGAAHAQTAAQAAPANDQAIQEVVVTAERRAVNVQSTPISVSVVSGATLTNEHVSTIADVQNLAPGLSVTNSGLTQNVNIRGLGNTTVSPAVTTGVAVFRDGLYEPEAILLSEPFYDIADVEVLKGPQGTIIGANSTGGALQINSNNPKLNGFSGYAEVQAGNYAEKKADGAVNLPITDTLAARIAFNVEHRDSYYRNVGGFLAYGSQSSNETPGQVDEQNVRASLLWKPNDNFQAVLKAEENFLNTGGYYARPLPFSSFYQYGYNGPSAYNNFMNLGKRDLDFNETAENDHQKAGRYSLDMKYKFNDGITLRSLTGFQHTREYYDQDLDYSAAGNGVAGARHQYHDIGPNDDYYSQEVDLISPDEGRLTWLAGASYFQRVTDVHDQTYNGTGAVTPIIGASNNPALPFTFACPATAGSACNLFSLSNTRSTQRLLGFFGQADFNIVSTLHLVVGARESIDTNYNYGYAASAISGTGGLAAGATNTSAYTYIPSLGRYHKSVPTYKVALNWTPIEGQFLYAFAARGYKEGGINNSLSSFAPEYVNDYEVGWKGRLMDGHVLTQVGGYYMQYKGMQQQTLSPTTGGNLVTNLGDSTIKGIEASFQAKFGAVSWDAGIAYNESKLGAVSAVATYLLASNASPAYPQCAAGSGVANGANGVVGGVPCTNYTGALISLSGEKNPYSPSVSFNTSLSYKYDLGDKGSLTPRITYTYISSQYASIFQTIPTGVSPVTGLPYPNFQLPSRSLVDLALTYKNGDWTAEIWGKNVTNLQYLAGISGNNGYLGDPRTFGLRVARNF